MKQNRNTSKRANAIRKELAIIEKEEQKLCKKSVTKKSSSIDLLAKKIPKELNKTLQAAFSKAFTLVFKQGVGVIEKTYRKDDIAANHDIQDFAVDRKGNRREIRKMKHSAAKSNLLNLSLTTVEGVGLGVLGIGLPDIALFVGMILKGIYEVSLHYGYDYDSSYERYLILKMISASLSKDDEWIKNNEELDNLMYAISPVNEDILKKEIESTANLLAIDMLVLKFVQGLPIVGAVGGAFNPVYYNKVLNYVRLKYYKRYLQDKLSTLGE